jgi:hypothetical protein|tara:strand:- start:195 stop:605 length:411 start_codon:yes stop_codon:yes gene_type:complete
MQKVRVYWNLHRNCWSIQDCKSGLVTGYQSCVVLEDSNFVVRKGGQKRVRQEGKKNVHAFAVGYMSEYAVSTSESLKRAFGNWSRVKYNPYTDNYFMHQNISDNQYKSKEWNYIPSDWVGIIHMDSTEIGNPKVYI